MKAEKFLRQLHLDGPANLIANELSKRRIADFLEATQRVANKLGRNDPEEHNDRRLIVPFGEGLFIQAVQHNTFPPGLEISLYSSDPRKSKDSPIIDRAVVYSDPEGWPTNYYLSDPNNHQKLKMPVPAENLGAVSQLIVPTMEAWITALDLADQAKVEVL